MPAACSDLEQPLPRWRRQLVEFSSKSCCRVVLFCMGFWRPRLVGYENYKKGQEMGAVGVRQLCAQHHPQAGVSGSLAVADTCKQRTWGHVRVSKAAFLMQLPEYALVRCLAVPLVPWDSQPGSRLLTPPTTS